MKYFFICLLLYSNVLFASDSTTIKCNETPKYDLADQPQEFNLSNNLRRKAGSADIAKGKLIYVKGRVTDINCVPIQNAVVFIWHADANGIYQTDQDDSNTEYDQNFLGSGKFITNNLGYYNFITVMPGSNQDRAPHINFLIQHPDFTDLQTVMFFSDYIDNPSDEVLKSFIEDNSAPQLIAPFVLSKEGVKTYEFNITLDGYNKYTTY